MLIYKVNECILGELEFIEHWDSLEKAEIDFNNRISKWNGHEDLATTAETVEFKHYRPEPILILHSPDYFSAEKEVKRAFIALWSREVDVVDGNIVFGKREFIDEYSVSIVEIDVK